MTLLKVLFSNPLLMEKSLDSQMWLVLLLKTIMTHFTLIHFNFKCVKP